MSVRIDRRAVLVLAGLALTTVAALVASVALGEVDIALGDVAAALVGAGDRANAFVVTELRLPRALTGLLAGAILGLAGAIFQLVTRNPLAAPDIVGVANGAALAAISVIVFRVAIPVPLAALAGGLAAGAVLYAFARRGGIEGQRLVLVGIGIAAFAQAGIGYVLTEGRIFEVATAYVWLIGSVNGTDWGEVVPLAIALAAGLVALLGWARRIDALMLGDDVAAGLGVDVERARLALLTVAVLLTSVAVSAAGPIGFVAFLAPHIGRGLTRATGAGTLLAAGAAAGALLVVAADLPARLAFGDTDVPVGIVTSILAAPYFLLALRRAVVA